MSGRYVDSQLAADKTQGDLYFSQIYSNAVGQPGYDGYWVSDLSDTGWYMTGTPPTGKSPKWFGTFFGVGGSPSWPAARLGSGTSPSGDGSGISGSFSISGSIVIQ